VLLTEEEKCEEELVKGGLDRESSEDWSSGSFSFSSDDRTVLILDTPFPGTSILVDDLGLTGGFTFSEPCRTAPFDVMRDFMTSVVPTWAEGEC
jgi:hypothetical protein